MLSAIARTPDGKTVLVIGLTDENAKKMLAGNAACFMGELVGMDKVAFAFIAEPEEGADGVNIPKFEIEETLAVFIPREALAKHEVAFSDYIEPLNMKLLVFRGKDEASMSSLITPFLGPTTRVSDHTGRLPFNSN